MIAASNLSFSSSSDRTAFQTFSPFLFFLEKLSSFFVRFNFFFGREEKGISNAGTLVPR